MAVVLVVVGTPVINVALAIPTMDSGGELKNVAMVISTVGCTCALALALLVRYLWRRSPRVRTITPTVALVTTVSLAVISGLTMWSSTL